MDERLNEGVETEDSRNLPYANILHGASYYILFLIFFSLENKVFLPSFYFFDFERTMFSSLLSNLCIKNTSIAYSRPFKVFKKLFVP